MAKSILREKQREIRIILPAEIEMTGAKDRPGRYDAVQCVVAGDYDGNAWLDLWWQMEDAGYIRTGPARWRDGGWRCRFKPAPYRTGMLRRLRASISMVPQLDDTTQGSPRELAPRFDGDFFGNWARRLTTLGVFSTIFVVLVQTRVKLEELRTIDPTSWNAEQGAQRLLGVIVITEGVVLVLLFAITIDLAYYTARRLYRVTGWSVAGLTTSLFLLFLSCGAGVFTIAESARQIIAELNAQTQARPD